MNQKYNFHLVNIFAWVIVAINILFIIFVPTHINQNSIVKYILLEFILIILLCLALTLLMIKYHNKINTWKFWAGILITLIISNLITNQSIYFPNSRIIILFTQLSFTSSWCIGISTGINLWHHDDGLKLIGWFSVLSIWLFAFVWAAQGNLIEILFYAINNPNMNSQIAWLNPLICILGWIIPLGLLSFLIHTLKILRKEYS